MTSRAMPKKVKQCFLYRRAWRNVFRKKKNATFIFVGDVGSGKSTAGLRLCEDLDQKFSVERVVFSVKDFLRLIEKGDSIGKLRPGSAILFDEIAGSEEGADSRSAMSKVNQRMSFLATTYRAKRYITVYCSPLLTQIDARVRRVGITAILDFQGIDFKANYSYARPYWIVVQKFSGKEYNPSPRLKDKESGKLRKVRTVHFPLPSSDLLKAYEKKKMRFLDSSIARWRQQLEKEEKSKKKVSMNEVYLKARKRIAELIMFTKDGKPRVMVSKLRLKYQLGETMSKQVKAVLQAEIDEGVLNVERNEL